MGVEPGRLRRSLCLADVALNQRRAPRRRRGARVATLAGVVFSGLILGFALFTMLIRPDASHPHGPDTHTHGDDGLIVQGDNSGSATPPNYQDDVLPSLVIVLDSNGQPIKTDLGFLTIDVAQLAAVEAQWLANGGDLTRNPPPKVADDEWFDRPTNHPLDRRWYTGFEVELHSGTRIGPKNG